VKKTDKTAELRAQKKLREAPKIAALQQHWEQLQSMVFSAKMPADLESERTTN